ncbi:MAG TPA: PIN domain-containing protein [Leptospiraceae bacterium]|nr:PIN domain-containing protein [Leptospiraceae bacterium]
MQSTLLDAGPLIALFDNSDTHSLRVQTFFKNFSGKFYTTWPVITETMHFLNFNPNVQSDFLKWLQRDPLRISPQDKHSLEKIRNLILKYQNVPMDLADASLLLVSEEEGINSIVTLDSDYIVYRSKKKKFKYLL